MPFPSLSALRHGRDVVRVSFGELGAGVRSLAEVVAPRPVPTRPEHADRPPIVLVHGYLGHPAMLRPLAAHLVRQGAPSATFVRYPSATWTIDRILDRIDQTVKGLGVPEVDIIGHSLGALTTRLWLHHHGGADHVRRFLSIGGPHAGTMLHRIVPSPVGQVMDPRGPWIRSLGRDPEPVPTWVLRARYDHQVFPPLRAAIPGVHDIVLPHRGHNALLFAKELHERAAEILAVP